MIDPLTKITTDRLRIRLLSREDAQALREITEADEITGAISFLKKGFSLEDAIQLIEAHEFWGMWEIQSDNLVGILGVHERADNEVELGYWIGVTFQGHGFASEALSGIVSHLAKHAPAQRLFAECYSENHASKRILVKSGFRLTGPSHKKSDLQRYDLKPT